MPLVWRSIYPSRGALSPLLMVIQRNWPFTAGTDLKQKIEFQKYHWHVIYDYSQITLFSCSHQVSQRLTCSGLSEGYYMGHGGWWLGRLNICCGFVAFKQCVNTPSTENRTQKHKFKIQKNCISWFWIHHQSLGHDGKTCVMCMWRQSRFHPFWMWAIAVCPSVTQTVCEANMTYGT